MITGKDLKQLSAGKNNMDDKINPNERVEAVWCKDSETGEEALIDCLTNMIIAKKDKNGNII